MSLKRGYNKKAQEGGASGFTIVGWIILAILLVIIVLALSGFFNPLLQKLNLLPGSGLAALVTACNGYVQIGSQTDYCNFRETAVNGVNEYVNCQDSRVQQDMDQQNRGAYACTQDAIRTECIALFKQGISNPVVSGQYPDVACANPLSTLGITPITCVQDLGGTISANGGCPVNAADSTETKPITNYNNDAEKGKVCCITPLS